MSDLRENALEEHVITLQELLAEKMRELSSARDTIDLLENIVHKAAKLAGHIPYLCSTLAERSTDLEQVAAELHRLLVHRET